MQIGRVYLGQVLRGRPINMLWYLELHFFVIILIRFSKSSFFHAVPVWNLKPLRRVDIPKSGTTTMFNSSLPGWVNQTTTTRVILSEKCHCRLADRLIGWFWNITFFLSKVCFASFDMIGSTSLLILSFLEAKNNSYISLFFQFLFLGTLWKVFIRNWP